MHFKPYSSDAERAAHAGRSGRRTGAHRNEARNQRAALDAKRKEQADTRAQFEADIQRYRELTAKPRS